MEIEKNNYGQISNFHLQYLLLCLDSFIFKYLGKMPAHLWEHCLLVN